MIERLGHNKRKLKGNEMNKNKDKKVKYLKVEVKGEEIESHRWCKSE